MSIARSAAEARARYVDQANQVAAGRGDAAELGKLAGEVARLEQEARRETARSKMSEPWSPPHAPHVTGRWTQRVFDDDGIPEEQTVVAKCATCGAEFKRACASGHVRAHVMRFALVHHHREEKRRAGP